MAEKIEILGGWKMQSRYSYALRTISIIILVFFSWTFGGLFDVAQAAKDIAQTQETGSKTGTVQKSKTGNHASKPQRSEEKLSKAVDDIETILNDDKADHETKKQRIRSKRSEIDADDKELRKQFSETEQKIKDLPEVIKKRHRDFVKHYDDNLRELKINLDDIEKTKPGSREHDEAVKRTKAHLERTKPPKRQKHLDPNKLPHRTEEPVWKEPRTKPEEFEKDSAQQSAFSRQQQNPILLAMNGEPTGLLNSPTPPVSSPWQGEDGRGSLSSFPSGNFQIALANPPTTADLAETIEIQFSPAISAKAAELGYKPVKIYEWVRNNIEYVPTYGSIQGADMCLQTKQCNDFDTASLLIALLRVSGIHARYVYGTIELPINKVKNWAGGFTDSMAALSLFASAGVPIKGMIDAGVVKYARVEHIWVEAFIDYIPSRGSRHKTGEGDTWIPLDASFKPYAYSNGIDIKTAVPFDAQSFIDQIKATSTINEAQGYVTGVNSSLIQQTMQDYQARVQSYISQNYPNATVGDVLGKKEIIKQEFPYLLGTLPYKTIVKGATYSSIPDSKRHRITFSVIKDAYDDITGTPINITKRLAELAGKKITLSYSPATAQDEAVINSFLPKPHADGTPIQPNELPSQMPAYLINLKPELRVDGQVIATGTPVTMGKTEIFTMTFSGPTANDTDVITNDIQAGEYLGIGLDLGRVSSEQMTALKTKLEATKAKLQNQDFSNLTKDDILGDLLYTTALSYHAELGVMNHVSAKTMGVVAITYPSETIFSFELKSNYSFGIPVSVSPGGLAMDADRLMKLVKTLDGNKDKEVQFMLNSGTNSSALEHSVPEQMFSTPDNPAYGISAVKALQLANEQGIPIYTINQTNIGTILPQLQLDGDTIADIQSAVNAGKVVTVSKTEITFNGWTGCGYIIIDPKTGAGAYMISGGMNGAWVNAVIFKALWGLLLIAAIGSGFLGIPIAIALLIDLLDTINSFIQDLIEKSSVDPATSGKQFLSILLGILYGEAVVAILEYWGISIFATLSTVGWPIVLTLILATLLFVVFDSLLAHNEFNEKRRNC